MTVYPVLFLSIFIAIYAYLYFVYEKVIFLIVKNIIIDQGYGHFFFVSLTVYQYNNPKHTAPSHNTFSLLFIKFLRSINK